MTNQRYSTILCLLHVILANVTTGFWPIVFSVLAVLARLASIGYAIAKAK